MGNRIYGNQGYAQNRRSPAFGDGTLLISDNGTYQNYQIEASVLFNMKPDSFVAVFGVAQEAKTADESNDKVNALIDDFLKNISNLGITKNDTYVDFITQNKVYDFQVKGDVAEQYLGGFETKKTVAVKYKNRESFEKIVIAATKAKIYDLVKVDYIVSDFDSVRAKLYEEAAKIIKQKEARYKSSFDMPMKFIGLSVERYDAFYPAERYQGYQAFESGGARSTEYNNNVRTTITLRKSSTFFYDPLDGNKFDKIINPIGIDPTVQFTLYMKAVYKMI